MIRSRLYFGLRNGTMNVGALARDERMKMVLPQACSYCGSTKCLAADHLVPLKRGGPNAGDNLVWACRSCNSSKCATDVLEWLAKRQQFPPLLVLRRYLKLAVTFSLVQGIMDVPLGEAPELPYVLDAIPFIFPPPCELLLWVSGPMEQDHACTES